VYYNYILLDLRKPGKYTFNSLNFSLLFKPFYVGKGSNDRWKNHKYNKNISHKDRLINILLKQYDLSNFVVLFNYDKCEKNVQNKEILIIKEMGRCSINNGLLTNLLPGGEGMSSEYMKINNPMFKISKSEHSKNVKESQWSGEKGEDRRKLHSERFSGSKNPSAKKYRIIEPNGNIIIVHGLKSFCQENNFSLNILRNWIDRGKIRKTTFKDNSFDIFESKRKLRDFEIQEIK